MTLPRKLAFKDKFVYRLIQEIDETLCSGEPIQFPDDTTPIKFIVEMNQDEFTKLYAAVLTGADLSYPDEAHDVSWILLRQLECPVSICEELTECLEPLFEALSTQITTLQTSFTEVSEAIGNNVVEAPEAIERNVAGERCGGASFVVDFMDFEIRRTYQAAEEGLLDNLIEATVEILRAIPIIEALPFDEMINVVNLMFENQVADYITDFDTLRDDLIGSLACFIEANDNLFNYQIWGDWLEFVGETYPTNRAGMLFGAFAPVRQSFANQIAQQIFNQPTLEQWFVQIQAEYFAGSQVAIACPTYVCPETFSHRFDFAIDEDIWTPFGAYAEYVAATGWFEDTPGIVWIQATIPDGGRKITSVLFETTTGDQILAQVGTPGDVSAGGVFNMPGAPFTEYTTIVAGATGFTTPITEIACRIAVDGLIPVNGGIVALTLNGEGSDPF